MINRRFDPKSREAIDYMLDFGSDFCYAFFTYERGWAVRLNPKTRDDKMYKFVEDVTHQTGILEQITRGNLGKGGTCTIRQVHRGPFVDPEIVKIVEKHITYTEALSGSFMTDRSSYYGYDPKGEPYH